MIEIKQLTKSFGDRTVLQGIDAVFETGKTNLIIGQSGSGKTVLMNDLVGLLEPTSGQILYDGRDFVNMSKKEKVLMRREMVILQKMISGLRQTLTDIMKITHICTVMKYAQCQMIF